MNKNIFTFTLFVILFLVTCIESSYETAKPVTDTLALKLLQDASLSTFTNTIQPKEHYATKGESITLMSLSALSRALGKALKEGGVANAIKFCDEYANPVTDSLSKAYQAKIKRTSLKIRNQENQPTPTERMILRTYQKQFEAGKALKPIVTESQAGHINFYKPIIIKPLCLKCHGQKNHTILADDLKMIQTHYPNDKAIGYKVDDFRGIWHIQFDKVTR